MGGRFRQVVGALFIGVQLASAVAWKRRLITGGMVASFLSGLLVVLRACGVDLVLTDEQLAEIGAAVVTIGGVLVSVLTAATSADVGLRARGGSDDSGGLGESSPALSTPDDSRFGYGEDDRSRSPGVPPAVPRGTIGGGQPGGVDPFRDHGA